MALISDKVAMALTVVGALIVAAVVIYAVVLPNGEMGKGVLEKIAEFISNPIKYLSGTGGGS